MESEKKTPHPDPLYPTQHPSRPMHKIVLPILMGGAAIFGLAYSTFIAGQYISGEKIPITKDSTQIIQGNTRMQPTPTIDPTWKSFTDSLHHYSLHYPDSFTQSPYTEGTYKGIQLTELGPTQKASGRVQTELFDGINIKILVMPKANTLPLKTYADKRRTAELQQAPDLPQPQLGELKTLTLGTKLGYSYTVEGMGKAQITFFELDDNTILQLTTLYTSDENLKKADDVIATLRF